MAKNQFDTTEPFPRGRATGTYLSYMNNNRIMKILKKAKHPVEYFSPDLWAQKKLEERGK